MYSATAEGGGYAKISELKVLNPPIRSQSLLVCQRNRAIDHFEE